MKNLAVNKSVSHDYLVLETLEAGLALVGSEVKSVRAGRVSLKESYAEVRNGEVFLVKCHVSPYEAANIFNHDPLRERKLLLHRREIRRLAVKTQERGLTIVPTRVFIGDKGRIKLEIALVRGKRAHEKREAIKKRDTEREIRAALKNRSR